MDRRTFLKIASMGSLGIAAGCSAEPEKMLYSLVHAPDDMIPGKASWYASTCRECPSGCGILAKNREGRVIKIEGNPLHPVNLGKLCMRGQAALQGVYNPDRIKTPLLKDGNRWRPLSYLQAKTLLKEKLSESARKGPDRVRMMTEVVGKALGNLFVTAFTKWNSDRLIYFEPYAYEGLKSANKAVFDYDGLVSYRLEEADFLLSFGADFLETWLSPVEYAGKFKAMHAYRAGKKGRFFQASPYQSLTGTNADLWLACNPGSEAVIALGLIREVLLAGKGDALEKNTRNALIKACQSYTKEQVIRLSGINPEHYGKLISQINSAHKPCILGPGTGASGMGSFQAHVAVNLLNVVLDPALSLIDFNQPHRVEIAAKRSRVLRFFEDLHSDPDGILLFNNVNPFYALSPVYNIKKSIAHPACFVVSFSNFMDETTAVADLILPTQLPLETWDLYEGKKGVVSTLQPAMKNLTGAPGLGDIFLNMIADHEGLDTNYQSHLYNHLLSEGAIQDEESWFHTLRKGGHFKTPTGDADKVERDLSNDIVEVFRVMPDLPKEDFVFVASPTIRFFDGRGANRPWLCEVPDPLTKVAWQTPVLMHPETLAAKGLKHGDQIRIKSTWGALEAPVYATHSVKPKVLIMGIGQGHQAYGRYAGHIGTNPLHLMPSDVESISGAPLFYAEAVAIEKTGMQVKLAHTDGSRSQHDRKIALSVELATLQRREDSEKTGLSMWEFPLTLPLPEGYRSDRDMYPAHDHVEYRWGMVVDLDRCIGCGACAAACYAENNIGLVGLERIVEGREMAWLSIERYHDPSNEHKVIFLPMLCQHCDNAPCESVCPVYAPHHSKEGLNNQIYNRCIGTRFCSQNCPYKVRRFNWFDWKRPSPLDLQLNPDVTARSKGVMEKCSFCIQRIKEAHGTAKDEGRKILDGEIKPACLQTCPTDAFAFGNLMDENSAVRKIIADQRAYQIMGYLNTKPAVIYLKKVLQEI